MAGELDALKAAVAANSNAVDSALTLIRGFKDQLAAAQASQDPAAIQSLIDELNAKDQELAAAVAENTPAAPAEPTP